jgi:glycosyltransferase involved in cell wall biosynthesis
MIRFPGKLALQQRVLPSYRAPFFDLLASACDEGMSLFTGLPRASEGITTARELRITDYALGKNIHILNDSFYLCYQHGLLNWLKEQNPDALIVEANPRYLSTSSTVSGCRRQPVIGWGLGSPPVSGLRNKRRFAFISQFDALISYSQRGADEYAALGFPRGRIFVAHNSISPPPSSTLPSRPMDLDPQPVILFVGRLQTRKRIDLLLRACAHLDSHPRLIIIGDGPERAALESLAMETYPKAEFIGAKHGVELKPYFTAADLFVLPGTPAGCPGGDEFRASGHRCAGRWHAG